MTDKLGARASHQALAVPVEPQERLDASGFDPSRRPWPLCGYAPGHYMGRCVKCEQQFDGDKRALECLECAAMSAKGLIEVYKEEARQLREWRDDRRTALDELIKAAAVFWGVGSEQHNLVRDVSDALFRDAIATEAAIAAEKVKLGSVHESAGRLRHRPTTPSLQTPQGGDS